MLSRIGGRALLRALELAAAARLRIQRHPLALSKEPLLDHARRRTGLTDFGPADFHEGLDAFLAACVREADFTALGRYVVASECVRILCNRLELTELWRQRPELLAVPVAEPVFIVGPPRSGTTFLHRLLAAAPELRAPVLREMMYPLAARARANGDRQRTPTAYWLRAVSPGLSGVHDVRMDAPEECTFIFQHTFRSLVLGTALNVPSYVTWLLRQDMTSTYRWHRRMLQSLAHGAEEAVWLLKSPAHMFSLPALLEVYPDARFVHLHRPMRDVVASLCSLRRALIGITSQTVEPRGIGMYTLAGLRVAAASVVEGRSRVDPARVLDVRHDEIMSKPLQVAERVWSFLGIDGERAARRAVPSVERDPPRRGAHTYRLEDFGVQPSAVDRGFADYTAWSERVAGATP